MARSNRPRRGGRPSRPTKGSDELDAARALSGSEQLEVHSDGTWRVRRVSGDAAIKTYRCPGCDQEITPGTPHVVAWSDDGPIGAFGDVTDRRHWHSPCWTARGRRGRK